VEARLFVPAGKKATIRLNQDLGVLEYLSSENALLWSTSTKDVVLLAEYTTSEGPYLEDYFLVFVTVENGKRYFATASFYSNGRDEVIKQLAEQ
jgi:hypothetical protein